MRASGVCAVVFAWAVLVPGAWANDVAPPPYLPSTSEAVAWIEADSSVVRARHGIAAAAHGGAALAAGAQEWQVRVQGQRREIQDGAPASREWLVQLERPWRVNGKAGLDRQLGEVENTIARARLGEARHESARALADLWIAELAARRRQALTGNQVELAHGNLDVVRKRRRAGDASLLDEQMALAELGDGRREHSMAQTALAKARAATRTRFGAEIPAGLGLVGSSPEEPLLVESLWLAKVLEEADPIKAAEAVLDRARMAASRARAEHVPDPTVGVFAAREARGNEKVVGVSVTVPLGGVHRTQRALQLEREVDVAQAALDQVRRETALEARTTWTEAQGSRERWQLGRETARLASENARLMQRAYALGEADLQALLLARRQAAQAAVAALEAQADSLRWEARLLVDAHLIWDLTHD